MKSICTDNPETRNLDEPLIERWQTPVVRRANRAVSPNDETGGVLECRWQ